MSDDGATARQKRIQGLIDQLRLEGVPDLFLDLWALFETEMLLTQPEKAVAVEEAIKHVTRELALHGIV